jgi:hypothetical protein
MCLCGLAPALLGGIGFVQIDVGVTDTLHTHAVDEYALAVLYLVYDLHRAHREAPQ